MKNQHELEIDDASLKSLDELEHKHLQALQ